MSLKEEQLGAEIGTVIGVATAIIADTDAVSVVLVGRALPTLQKIGLNIFGISASMYDNYNYYF